MTTTTLQMQADHLLKIPALAHSLWDSALTDPKFSSPSGDEYALFEGPLYQALASPALLDNEKRRLVYSYLTLSGNAKCVRTHNPTQWRLRTSWQEPSEDALHQFIDTNTVHTSTINTPVKEKDAPMATITTTIQVFSPQQQAILDYFDKHAEQPLVPKEIAEAISMSETSIRRAARTLCESGALNRREETEEEHSARTGRVSFTQRAFLYHPDNPVPLRTLTQKISEKTAPVQRHRGAIVSSVASVLNSEYRTATDIAREAQVSADQARVALFYMEKKGRVERETRTSTSPNMPYTYYRRAEPADAPASTVPVTATAVPEPVAVVVQDVPTPEQPNPAQFFESYVASQVRAATASLEDENAALKATLASIRALLAR